MRRSLSIRLVSLTLALGACSTPVESTREPSTMLTEPNTKKDFDADGVVDALDACPKVPEDMDGFEDSDGCPEMDNDKDGVVDSEDGCPIEPEAFNGYLDEDGCPDDLRALYCPECDLDEDAPVVPTVVLFAPDDHIPRPDSYEALDRVAERAQRRRASRVLIVGHVSNSRSEEDALLLSKERAKIIRRLLVDRGVRPESITIRAEGTAKPRVSAASSGASVLNDRVEISVR